MDPRFLQAVHAKGATVCGSSLRPFSLAHRVALAAIDSPFMAGDRPLTPTDLALALAVCRLVDPCQERVGRPCLRERVRFWRWRLNPERFREDCRAFVQYLEEQASGPKILRTEKPEAATDMPWVLCVVASLVRNGIPLTEAWSMSEGRAIWLHVAFLRMEGADIKLWSPEHEEARRLLENLNTPSTNEQ